MFEAAFANANLPGAVGMIVDRDGVCFAEALGQADAVGGTAMRRDSLFQIASMTKALTSVAAMQLVEQGRLGWMTMWARSCPIWRALRC